MQAAIKHHAICHAVRRGNTDAVTESAREFASSSEWNDLLIGEIRASPASLPGPRALQTCFRSARTDTHTRQHSELSLRPLRPLRPLPPSAASTALPPLPPLPLCRSQERLELCSAAVSLCRSGSAPLHCCCVHARTHTHARIASSLCPLCRLCPSAASAQGALPLCRSAALPLCRSAEPSRPCRFWHSRWGRFCRPSALPPLLLLPLPPEGRFCQGAPLLPLLCLALRLQGTEGMAHYMDDYLSRSTSVSLSLSLCVCVCVCACNCV